MLLIRRFEEKAGQLYGLGLIGGFCHLYIGQEAVAVGLQSALDGDKDCVITGYRDHGHMLAYGIDPKVIMAELTGRAAGISKGKGGSMHMFSTEHKFYGGHGIVGAQVSLGTGLAFAHKYNERWRRVPRLFRRRRGEPGPGVRKLQHGRAVEAADHLRDREQPVRDGHQRQPRVGRGPALSPRRELPHSRHPGRRHGRARVPRRGRGGARLGARGQGADHPRDEDLSLSRPFDVRSGQVSQPRGSAGGARQVRSDRACQEAARGAGRRARTS